MMNNFNLLPCRVLLRLQYLVGLLRMKEKMSGVECSPLSLVWIVEMERYGSFLKGKSMSNFLSLMSFFGAPVRFLFV